MVEGNLILDRYRPLELSGKGANGTVDICWDTRIQRRVAIKRLPIVDAGARGAVPGLAEARTGAMLSHPAIVSVIDFEVTQTEALLIMEAIEGPTLAQLIDADEEHMLSCNVVAAVAQAVGDALDFAHENQVLHLDIKPENILVDMSGHVKVSDFGVSELADAQGFSQASGGTIGYMPPEQMLEEDLDQRCDEFALAVVIYEALTGECPFAASTLDESLNLIDHFDVAPPSAFRDDLEEDLDNVLLTAMDPNRDMRFETVLDFLYALEPTLGDAKEGVFELKELVARDDEAVLAQAQPAATSTQRRTRSLPSLPTERVAMFVLCGLAAGFVLTHAALVSFEMSIGVALVIALIAAIAPVVGGVAALALCGLACILEVVLPLFGLSGLEQVPPIPHILMGASWLLSAVFMTWSCTRERKISSVFGAFLAAALPVAALLIAHAPSSGASFGMEALWAIVATVASACLVIVGTMARSRQRGEQ